MSALQLFCQSRFKLQLVKLGLVFLPLAAALFFVCLWWFFCFFCIAHAWVCLPAVLAFFGARLLVRRFLVWLPMVLAFPCFVIGLLASPLCGAGTYFSLPAAKKSRQKKAAHTASS
ncbi:hypothetical protein PQQ99_28995 [Paraburkholderia sediminicola]|uniref:hypothetical protein n=1 Tax=Paraburkholderia sediminicola TaxID=458836 RepID=UPI0038B812DB